MNAMSTMRHVASALKALRDLLALTGVAAICAFLLIPLPIERALPALPTLPGLVIDQLVAEPAKKEETKPVADTILNREQQVVAEYISKRYRVAEDAIAQFVSIAYRAGEEHRVDPLLILAVMAIESRYNPVAESLVGARGLMQVIPKYHPEKLDAHGGEEVLLQPEVNILVGAQILREYQRRFGDTETALQVYAGAFDEPTSRYSNKVFAEKALLDAIRAKARRQQVASAT